MVIVRCMKLDNFIEEVGLFGLMVLEVLGQQLHLGVTLLAESWVMQDYHMVKCRECACRSSPLSS